MLRNEADARRCRAGSLAESFQAHRQFRAEARFSTWLIQITVNEARMRKRRAHAEHVWSLIGEQQDEEGDYTPRDFADWREIPSETLERKEIRSRLAARSRQLWPKNIARSSCCATCST